jgi:hypothetical protein
MGARWQSRLLVVLTNRSDSSPTMKGPLRVTYTWFELHFSLKAAKIGLKSLYLHICFALLITAIHPYFNPGTRFQVINETTLGLYSFRLVVDQVWSVQRTKNKSRPRCLSFTTGNARPKRPPSRSLVRCPRGRKLKWWRGMNRILISTKGGRPEV